MIDVTPAGLLIVATVALVAFYLGRRSVRVEAAALTTEARPLTKPDAPHVAEPREIAAEAAPDAGAAPAAEVPAGQVLPAPTVTATASTNAKNAKVLPSLADAEADDGSQSASKSMVSYIDELGAHARGERLALTTAQKTEADMGNRCLVIEDEDWSLIAVTDGLSSRADGDIAASLVLDSLSRAFHERPVPGSISARRPDGSNRLVWALEEANEAIHNKAASNPKYEEIAAAVVAALFLFDQGQVCIAHVGDSRAYRVREGRCHLLTADHTLASKGVTGPLAAKLYRALGMKRTVKVDLVVASIEPGDVYLVCTDGVTKSVGTSRLPEVATAITEPEQLAERLLETGEGGHVNAAAIVARAEKRVKNDAASTKAGTSPP